MLQTLMQEGRTFGAAAAKREGITEAQLKDSGRAGAVTSMQARRVDGAFILVVTLSWKAGDLMIVTGHNNARTWRSLDRLVAYVTRTVPLVERVGVLLDPL